LSLAKFAGDGIAGTGTWRRFAGLLLILSVAAGSVLAWRWRSGFDAAAATAILANSPAAPLAFLVLHVAASLLFVPRTMLALVAGLAFGLWWGVVWAAAGSVLGAVAGFLIARHTHSGLIDPARWARFAALLAAVERGGWRMVMLLRLVPVIPHSLGNYALGLTRLRLGPYAIGSLLGQLPLTIAYVDLGAGGGRAMLGTGDWLLPVAAGFIVLALSSLVPVLMRRYMREALPAPEA
jgi:uncharacterized membrane protein YdjX (TVP38/TMEM64 family)